MFEYFHFLTIWRAVRHIVRFMETRMKEKSRGTFCLVNLNLDSNQNTYSCEVMILSQIGSSFVSW
jgi:hypothetical protein